MLEPRQIRQALGLSQEKVADEAGVSRPTLVLYEAKPAAVIDDAKRSALDAVYATLRARLGQ